MPILSTSRLHTATLSHQISGERWYFAASVGEPLRVVKVACHSIQRFDSVRKKRPSSILVLNVSNIWLARKHAHIQYTHTHIHTPLLPNPCFTSWRKGSSAQFLNSIIKKFWFQFTISKLKQGIDNMVMVAHIFFRNLLKLMQPWPPCEY